MSYNNVQILNFNHNIVEVGPDNKIVITDQVKCNSITIPQPVTNILQINSPGPQGQVGPLPPLGGSDTQVQYNNNGNFGGITELTYDGSLVTATNINATGSFSGSFAGIIAEPVFSFTVGGDPYNSNYYIEQSGIYFLTGVESPLGILNFPDPTYFTGQKIIILNVSNTNINYIGNTNCPVYLDGTTPLPYIQKQTTYTFISNERNWVLLHINEF